MLLEMRNQGESGHRFQRRLLAQTRKYAKEDFKESNKTRKNGRIKLNRKLKLSVDFMMSNGNRKCESFTLCSLKFEAIVRR